MKTIIVRSTIEELVSEGQIILLMVALTDVERVIENDSDFKFDYQKNSHAK